MKLFKIVNMNEGARIVDIVWAENRSDALKVVPFTNVPTVFMAIEVKTMEPEFNIKEPDLSGI